MSTAALGGITVAYDDVGHGDPLVLVHGHPFNRSMWRPQVDEFSRAGWRVIAPDLRGYGGSTVVPGETTMDVFAADLARLLDHLGVGPVVLGGLSMGGQIVMEFCRQSAGRVRGVLLADTSPQPETETGRQQRAAVADRITREGIGPYASEVLTKMIAPATIETQPAVAEHVLGMMRGTDPAGAAAAIRGRCQRPDYVPVLAGLGVPALVVVGSGDEYTPVSDAELMGGLIAGARVAIIEGAAHMPNLEYPDQFNAELGAFLKEL